jgi:signal peptidase
MKKETVKKTFKIIKGIINTCIVFIIFAFVLMVCLQRFSGNKISFLNYRMFTVVTGSMEPKYNIGDVLIAKEKDPSEIRVGDAISYLASKGEVKNNVITHQVVSISKDENGKYLFHSKGIANLIEDPVVHEDQLYGVVVYKTKLLSSVRKIISTDMGMLVLIIIPIIYIIVSEMIAMLIEKEEKRREKSN